MNIELGAFVLLAPFALYLFFRIVFSAWFKTKSNYNKTLLDNFKKGEKTNG